VKILAIETSCDETAVSILDCTGELPTPSIKVLGNALLSQIHIHKEYGGVYPMLAKREHEKNLPILLEQALSESLGNSEVVGAPAERVKTDAISQIELLNIDYIAVTAGPGLEPALWAGIVFAEELGQKSGKPVVPVNHMEGHLFSYLFEKREAISLPAIGLLVSGGHTELILVEDFDKFGRLGETRDDAVGEAFDKTARLLGLPYPGGPKISELASISRARGNTNISFPSPMLKSDDFDFSYSGLKTAVLYKVREMGELSPEAKEDVARAFEDAAIEPLIYKTRKAVEKFGAKSLIIGGGVAANKYLQDRLRDLSLELSLDLRLPLPELTTDNAVMIGIAAYVRALTSRIEPSTTITARGNLKL
jgi:N6-L-threonylcarbamoyladenine synthase